MKIDQVATSVLAEFTDEWFIHKDADGKLSWAPYGPTKRLNLPLWILIGQLLIEEQQGIFEVEKSHEANTANQEKTEDYFCHLRTDRLLKALPPQVRNTNKWRLCVKEEQQGSPTLQTTMAFHLAYYGIQNLRHHTTFEKANSYVKGDVNGILLSLIELIESIFYSFKITGINKKLYHAQKNSPETVAITDYQAKDLAKHDEVLREFCRKRRDSWRLSLKTLQTQLSRLHRDAEDMLNYWLIIRRKKFVGIRIQLGQKNQRITNLSKLFSHSQETQTRSLIDRFPLQPNQHQLKHLQKIREAFFTQIKRRRWFKKIIGLNSLTAYFWTWCYNPIAGWYLDVWLLFEHNKPDSCAIPLITTQLEDTWESLISLKFESVVINSDVPFLPSAQSISSKHWLLQPLKSLSAAIQTQNDRYTHPWINSKAMGNTLIDDKNLGDGLSVLQLFYQGRLFHIPMPENRGNTIPAFGKSHYPRGEKKSNMPDAMRQSLSLNDLLADRLTTLLDGKHANAHFLFPVPKNTAPPTP